jgi:cysteinyl-tRNA synthetase
MPYFGQLRLAVCVDIAIRWLEASGYRVTYCRNATELDAAVLAAAEAEGTPCWVLAERARRYFAQGCAALACRPPDVDPPTAGQIPEMIACFGPVFDIHAECTDLCQPERGRHCLRLGHVRPGESMSEAVDRLRPAELRYFLAQAHYRAAIECSGALLEEAAASYQRIERFVTRAHRMLYSPGGANGVSPLSTPRQRGGDPPFTPLPRGTGTERPTEYPLGLSPAMLGVSPPGLPPTGLGTALEGMGSTVPPVTPDPGGESLALQEGMPISFAAAMDDDLDVAVALKAVHATVHDGNYAIRSGDRDEVAASLAQVRSMLAVLGLDPLDPHWATSDSSGRLHGVIDGLVALALRQQEAARARGDYASASSIRDTLETMGVEVEDTAAGPRWELKR